MKSIVQEGSSICKAVESAWQSAGNPKEFTVKVLEEPRHNFIGMTTKSAKVAIYFKEAVSAQRTERAPRTQRQQRPTRQSRTTAQPRSERAAQPVRQEREKPVIRQEPQLVEKKEQEFDGIFWTPEMLSSSNKWLQDALNAMQLSHIKYSTDVNRLYLRIYFDEPVHQNISTEKQIFRSFALLLMQYMRNQLKRPLKGFKVILSRAE